MIEMAGIPVTALYVNDNTNQYTGQYFFGPDFRSEIYGITQ